MLSSELHKKYEFLKHFLHVCTSYTLSTKQYGTNKGAFTNISKDCIMLKTFLSTILILYQTIFFCSKFQQPKKYKLKNKHYNRLGHYS